MFSAINFYVLKKRKKKEKSSIKLMGPDAVAVGGFHLHTIRPVGGLINK